MSVPKRVAVAAGAAVMTAALAAPLLAQPRLPEASSPPPPVSSPVVAALPAADIIRRLETQGHVVQEFERQRDGFEIEVTQRDGRRLELRLDPAGRVLRERADD